MAEPLHLWLKHGVFGYGWSGLGTGVERFGQRGMGTGMEGFRYWDGGAGMERLWGCWCARDYGGVTTLGVLRNHLPSCCGVGSIRTTSGGALSQILRPRFAKTRNDRRG